MSIQESSFITFLLKYHQELRYQSKQIIIITFTLKYHQELREAAGFYDSDDEEETEEDLQNRKVANNIRKAKALRLQEHRMKKTTGSNSSVLPRKASLRVAEFNKPQKRKVGSFLYSYC